MFAFQLLRDAAKNPMRPGNNDMFLTASSKNCRTLHTALFPGVCVEGDRNTESIDSFLRPVFEKKIKFSCTRFLPWAAKTEDQPDLPGFHDHIPALKPQEYQ